MTSENLRSVAHWGYARIQELGNADEVDEGHVAICGKEAHGYPLLCGIVT